MEVAMKQEENAEKMVPDNVPTKLDGGHRSSHLRKGAQLVDHKNPQEVSDSPPDAEWGLFPGCHQLGFPNDHG